MTSPRIRPRSSSRPASVVRIDMVPPFREMPGAVGGSYHCVAAGTSDARVPRPRRAGIAASRDATYAFVLMSDRMGSSSSLSRRARSTGDDAFQLAEERTLELARLAGVKDRCTFERGARLVHFDCVSVDEILITPTFRKRGYWEPVPEAQWCRAGRRIPSWGLPQSARLDAQRRSASSDIPAHWPIRAVPAGGGTSA